MISFGFGVRLGCYLHHNALKSSGTFTELRDNLGIAEIRRNGSQVRLNVAVLQVQLAKVRIRRPDTPVKQVVLI
jgi:hypothetical protein